MNAIDLGTPPHDTGIYTQPFIQGLQWPPPTPKRVRAFPQLRTRNLRSTTSALRARDPVPRRHPTPNPHHSSVHTRKLYPVPLSRYPFSRSLSVVSPPLTLSSRNISKSLPNTPLSVHRHLDTFDDFATYVYSNDGHYSPPSFTIDQTRISRAEVSCSREYGFEILLMERSRSLVST